MYWIESCSYTTKALAILASLYSEAALNSAKLWGASKKVDKWCGYYPESSLDAVFWY